MPDPLVRYKIRAIDETAAGLGSVRSNFSRLRGVFAGLAGVVGAIGFGRLVTGAIEAADELDKLTSKIGADVEDFQRLQQVADLSGVSMNKLGTALQRQTRRISEATKGTGEAVKALAELGISAENIATLDPTQQFIQLSQALSGVANQGDRVRLAMRFWDTEGVELVNLIDQVGDAYFDLEAATDSAAVKTQEQIDAAVRAKDAWTRLKTTIEGLAQTFVLEFAEPIENTLEYLRELVPEVVKFFKELSVGYDRLRENNIFKTIADYVFSIYDRIKGLLVLMTGFSVTSQDTIQRGPGVPGGARSGAVPSLSSGVVPQNGITVINQPIFTGAPNGALE